MKKELKLVPWKFALALTIITASTVFLATIITMFYSSEALPIISTLYQKLGYTISFQGAFIGAFYIATDTFILTYLFAWIYNKLLN